jgi:glycosyltransferase involved in cell wall biosynthesis
VKIVQILSHSIEEFDMLKLHTHNGHQVFSLGGYIDPRAPHDPKRPALPEADFPERAALQVEVDALDTPDNIGTAAAWIPDLVMEWADVIICHHYLERIYGQWDHLADFRRRGGRVVWRTVGQSVESNERAGAHYSALGLEIVRYSPKEEAIPGYAGADALIRFYKDPAEWDGWHGGKGEPFVGNITQDLLGRHPWTNAQFYIEATQGLQANPAGPGSERLPGGIGELSYEEMQDYLRAARCYVYTGTQPASYTLGLLEALMTGVPVVSIGPSWMRIFPHGSELFEGHEFAFAHSDDPETVRTTLSTFLREPELAARCSQHQRHRAIQTFGLEPVAAAWQAFLL